jgi:hypothetical protein
MENALTNTNVAAETAINNASAIVADVQAPKISGVTIPTPYKVAAYATIGMAALGTISTGLMLLLIKRNGGFKLAFAKKAALNVEDLEDIGEDNK